MVSPEKGKSSGEEEEVASLVVVGSSRTVITSSRSLAAWTRASLREKEIRASIITGPMPLTPSSPVSATKGPSSSASASASASPSSDCAEEALLISARNASALP